MHSIQRLVLAGTASLALLAPESSAQSCPVHETTIFAGQTTDAGAVRVTNTTDHLVIEVETNASWLMEEVHLYAGVGDPPLTSNGNPNPGQFPYNTTFGVPGEPFHREVIPLGDLGVSCGDAVDVAVHVSVAELDDQGNLTGRQETGWAFGNKTWPGNQWGWWFCYDTCCLDCPGAGFDLTVTELQETALATLTASGAASGERVDYFASCGFVDCDQGLIVDFYGGLAFDLVGPIVYLGSSHADAQGVATLDALVTRPPGYYLVAQAMIRRGTDGADSIKSNPVEAIVLD